MNKSIRILYIDENTSDRKLICDVLNKNHGQFELAEADNRQKFKKLLEESDFDIILADFNASGSNGYDAIDTAKEKNPEAPVILAVDSGADDIGIEGINHGASDYIVKSSSNLRLLPILINTTLEKKYLNGGEETALELLKFERDNLNKIFEAMSDGIYIIDENYNIQNANDALVKEFGDYKGRKCYEYFNKKDEICSWCQNQYVWSGKTVRWEGELIRNGKTYDILDIPITLSDGSIGKLAILHDLSERIEAEAASLEHDKSEKQFQEKLIVLCNVYVKLLECKTEDELWKQAIEKGKEELGFGRLKIWLNTKSQDEKLVVYATSSNSSTVDERHFLTKAIPGSAMAEADAPDAHVFYKEKDDVIDDLTGEVLGQAAHAAAPICAGNKNIGGIVTDNYQSKEPITEKDREILMLYSVFLGSLCSRLQVARKVKSEEKEEKDSGQQEPEVQKFDSLGELAGDVAKEFNDIFMAVIGNADIALHNLSPHSPVRDELDEIKQALLHGSKLCKQMLAYSSKSKFEIEPLHPGAFVKEMNYLIEASVPENVSLKYSFAEDLSEFEGDSFQVRQVILNMVKKAVEDIGVNKGVINISTGAMHCDRAYLDTLDPIFKEKAGYDLPEGEYTYIQVSDDGHGMGKKTQEEFFNKVFVANHSKIKIGMAAVLAIVRKHKGAIKIYSEPGFGTTYKVFFPAMDFKEAEQKEAEKSPVKTENWKGSGTVLFVDDEEAVRRVGERMLEDLGFEVVTAKDGRNAVEIYRKRKDDFVCVILDLVMPRLDGEQAYRELRVINQDAKVILVSGFDKDEATRRFAGKGLSGFIQKPYNEGQLADKLREVIS